MAMLAGLRVSWIARLAMLACVLGLWTTAEGRAQSLDALISRGEINIGCLIDAPPYGFLNGRQQPEGYDIDVAHLLGKDLGVKVNIIPVTGQTRIPYLLTGKIDVVIATMGITPQRARQVLFSVPYGAISAYILASKDRTIKTAADLKGLRIGVPRGSTFDYWLTAMVGHRATIMRFDGDASTYQALVSGQVDALAQTGIILDAINQSHPSLHLEKKMLIGRQWDAIAVRRGQYELMYFINTVLAYHIDNGDLNVLYEKWFHEPLPTPRLAAQ